MSAEPNLVKPPSPWTLPARGLALVHGDSSTPRLSHYFLTRLLLQGKRVLLLDGANCADPHLLERLMRGRGAKFEHYSRQIQIARAFTCFQLTELIARVPGFLQDFPAHFLFVTALPDLYFDEDIRNRDAEQALRRALRDLRQWALQELRQGAVAIFSAASTFVPPAPRRRFLAETCAAATEVWEFRRSEEGKPAELRCTRKNIPPAPAPLSGIFPPLRAFTLSRPAEKNADWFARAAKEAR